MARFTIFGASGFIGRNLAAHLTRSGHEVVGIGRERLPPAGVDVGHAIYCIGLTANFRTNLTATARAHVGILADVLDNCRYESFLYLSSTRVYMGATATGEDAALQIDPRLNGDVYNLSKLTGEALCLAQPDRRFRAIRLANVIGPGDAAVNFLPSLLAEARRTGKLVVHTSPQSAKDYVDIDDVCCMIERIALDGRERLYNLASGTNTSNADIVRLIEQHLSVKARFEPGASTVSFPPIDTTRIRTEFSFHPIPFAQSFGKVLSAATTEPA